MESLVRWPSSMSREVPLHYAWRGRSMLALSLAPRSMSRIPSLMWKRILAPFIYSRHWPPLFSHYTYVEEIDSLLRDTFVFEVLISSSKSSFVFEVLIPFSRSLLRSSSSSRRLWIWCHESLLVVLIAPQGSDSLLKASWPLMSRFPPQRCHWLWTPFLLEVSLALKIWLHLWGVIRR